ncbi:hypothetical protein [Trabulsiella odontotermitis]|uniref:hypothetical protein n=1 Tax=Trabulsiella odontotermitis TaxID=379893 RepID=UPI000F611DCE|nr:hypothetical protein [Trabulsiella odontotermitis]
MKKMFSVVLLATLFSAMNSFCAGATYHAITFVNETGSNLFLVGPDTVATYNGKSVKNETSSCMALWNEPKRNEVVGIDADHTEKRTTAYTTLVGTNSCSADTYNTYGFFSGWDAGRRPINAFLVQWRHNSKGNTWVESCFMEHYDFNKGRCSVTVNPGFTVEVPNNNWVDMGHGVSDTTESTMTIRFKKLPKP